jgi:hypothetical protein
MVDKASTPQQEYSGPEKGSYTSFGDMFDGGGPGRSGGPFQGGGLLSAAANAFTGNNGVGVGPDAGVGFAGYGYNDKQGNWVPAGIDMRNGGGPGMAGSRFMGGGQYSAIANMLGIRPMGFADTMAASAMGGVKNPAIMSSTVPMALSEPSTMPVADTSPASNAAYASGTPAYMILSRLGLPPSSPAFRLVNDALYNAGIEGAAPPPTMPATAAAGSAPLNPLNPLPVGMLPRMMG